MTISFVLVGIGGGIGSMMRFYISQKMNSHFIGTWIANVSGSLLLAILLKFFLLNIISEIVWLTLGVGFCGAYTTFSTFGNETIQLILSGKFRTAVYYVISSFTVSIVVVSFVLL